MKTLTQFFNFSQATLTSRPAGLQRAGEPTASATALPDPVCINAPSQLENSVCNLSANISMLEFLSSRGTNLRSKQWPPLTSVGNVIAPPAPEPPITCRQIVHVKPFVDTALPSQDSPQSTTQVLNLGSEQQQAQLTSIENPPASELQQGRYFW